MARLYANENFPLPAVIELRRLGHDVLTTVESGNAGLALSDESVLSFAVSEKRAVLTLNRRHFIRLHSERPDHGGIVVCSFDSNFSALAERIHLELNKYPLLDGKLVRINRHSQRVEP